MHKSVDVSGSSAEKMKRPRLGIGGKHQRLARAGVGASSSRTAPSHRGDAGPVLRPGPLDGDPEVDKLVELWSLGVITAKTVHEIAAAAVLVAPRPAMN